MNVWESEASMVYRASSRTVKVTKQKPVSKKEEEEKEEEEEEEKEKRSRQK